MSSHRPRGRNCPTRRSRETNAAGRRNITLAKRSSRSTDSMIKFIKRLFDII